MPKTGHKCKLYRNSGTAATPTWVLVDTIGDLSIPDFSRALAELQMRASEFTLNLPGILNSIAVEFRLIMGAIGGATNYTAIQTAFLAGTIAEWAVMDGLIATEGSQGLRAPMVVEAFPMDQGLNNVVGHDIRLAVAYMEEAAAVVSPSWYVVAGS